MINGTQRKKKNGPSLNYVFLDESEKLNRAFDILFEEVATEIESYKTVSLSTSALTSMNNQVYDNTMEFLTNDEVAKSLRVNPRTVDRWLKRGLIKGYKLGEGKTALWRIPKSEVKKFLEKHRNEKAK